MIEISDKSKILILIVLVGIVIFLLSKKQSKQEPMHNQGIFNKITENFTDTNNLPEGTDDSSVDTGRDSQSQDSQNSQDSLADELVKKMTTRNTAKNGQYRHSSYDKGNRDQQGNLDKFFNNENPLDQQNAGFTSVMEGSEYASYVPGKSKKQSEKDKFDAGALLPKEQNDWFDDPQAGNIKSSHLINIYRPTQVNTIQTSLKNPSWDIRGAPPNPKFVVSAWGNSSIEPDNNLKNSALCN